MKAACVFFVRTRVLNHIFQVTEAKGLGWLLVGTVTCASADFFMAKPQLMLVDITELGTIKLQLEVVWRYSHNTRAEISEIMSMTTSMFCRVRGLETH